MKFKQKYYNNGFTLIELLIVVAIIGILAAIAIPQYSSYRIKSFNSTAVSDLINAKTAQEALFAAHQTYGASEANVSLALVSGAGGPGALIIGGVSPATDTVAGSALAGRNPVNVKVGIGVAISNGVCFYSTTVPVSGSYAYVMVTKHTQGSRIFVSESTSSTTKFVQNDVGGIFVGVPLAVGGFPATGVPAAASAIPSITILTPGNGSPNPNWSAL